MVAMAINTIATSHEVQKGFSMQLLISTSAEVVSRSTVAWSDDTKPEPFAFAIKGYQLDAQILLVSKDIIATNTDSFSAVQTFTFSVHDIALGFCHVLIRGLSTIQLQELQCCTVQAVYHCTLLDQQDHAPQLGKLVLYTS